MISARKRPERDGLFCRGPYFTAQERFKRCGCADEFARGEAELQARVPKVKFEYTHRSACTRVITPNVWQNEIQFLRSVRPKRSEILREFVQQNNRLVGVTDNQAPA